MAEVVIKGMTLHKIEVKGNCMVCRKPLGENDGLFLCAECQKLIEPPKEDSYEKKNI